MVRVRLARGFAVGATLLAVTAALAASDVTNSKHNLSSTTGTGQITDKSTNENQVCVFCHTPHRANPAAPLWNHTRSAVAAYGVYTSPTLQAVPAEIAGGTDTSNLCMSCHDGTIAVNNLVIPANDIAANPTMGSGHELDATGKIVASRPANLGTSLTNDHPVNFTYDAALAAADGALVVPSSAQYVDAGHTVPLFASKVQCASCHNAHDNTYTSFLVKSNAGSALCLTCHNK